MRTQLNYIHCDRCGLKELIGEKPPGSQLYDWGKMSIEINRSYGNDDSAVGADLCPKCAEECFPRHDHK